MGKEEKLTPMMEQYNNIKKQHKDAVLFFRLGDFYEMFKEDAVIASRELGLALTRKPAGKGKYVPLAGIPYHAADGYLSRLIKKGYKVAICEQVEDPKLAKRIVDRDVIRIVTPGTVIEDNLLEDKKNNYLASVYTNSKNRVGLSFLDISTGKFLVTEFTDDEKYSNLNTEIAKFDPVECIVSEEISPQIIENIEVECNTLIEKIEDWRFDYRTCFERLIDHFKVSTLEGFGVSGFEISIGCAGVLIEYVGETQKVVPAHINKIVPYSIHSYLTIDNDSQRNLELTKTIRDGRKEWSLLWVLDETVLGSGARLLNDWLLHPLRSAGEIIRRQESVTEFYNNMIVREEMRKKLKEIYDIERIVSKISCKTVTPKDLVSLRISLEKLPYIKELIEGFESPLLKEKYDNFDLCSDVKEIIIESISDNPPAVISDGGVIREGYNNELDEVRKIMTSGKDWILDMEKKEKLKTGITSLKIGFNKVFGYYIDVTKTNLSKVPDNYIRKQTLANSERFITEELKEYESKVLDAEEKIGKLEESLFNNIRDEIAKEIKRLQNAADILSNLDVLAGLAEVAVNNNYVKPDISDEDYIKLVKSRHPVIEKMSESEKFVPNDIELDNEDNNFLIITGPNMAGKSTYIRQVALIVLMAQMGSYVPCEKAEIGIVDRIFTRVGASDNLVKGLSTFMVEMIEAANILNNATSKSLIILDEIGRGTSTYDGLSLAWSISEFIINKLKSKTLFATHYHELIELVKEESGVKNFNVAVKEWNDKVIFLRKVVEGGTSRSYGIEVARLAGLPDEVIERAKEILFDLESKGSKVNKSERDIKSKKKFESEQLSLFEIAVEESDEVKQFLDLNINEITPLESMKKLSELQEKLKRLDKSR